MEIKELLKQYYATKETNPGLPDGLWLNGFGARILSDRLRSDMEHNPDTKFFHAIMSAYKLNYDADDICKVCDSFGLYSVASLLSWLTELNKTNKNIDSKTFFNTITGNKKIDIKANKITTQELRNIISNKFPKLTCVSYTDSFYQIPDLNGLTEVVSFSPSDAYPWKTDSRDCDDFARMLRGWLSEINLGNLAIAYCEVNAFYDKEFKYAHAINLAVIKEDGEYKIKLIEPQTNTISDLNFDPPGLTANRYEVRKLMF